MEIIAAISALNAIISLIGNATKQASEIGALVTDLQANNRSMTADEWKKVEDALAAWGVESTTN